MMAVGTTYKVNTGMPGYGTNNNGKLTGSVGVIPCGGEVEVVHVSNWKDALVQYQDADQNRVLYAWVIASELDLEAV